MPAKNGRQYRLMQAVANNPGKARTIGGPSPSVAKEFINKTPSKKRKLFSAKKG